MNNTNWYYLVEGKQEGPFTKEHLQSLFSNNQLPSDTLLWNPHILPSWTPANQVKQFQVSSSKSNLVNARQNSNQKAPSSETPRPWTRFAARYIDCAIYGVLFYFLLELTAPIIFQYLRELPKLVAYIVFAYIMLPIFWATLEATLISSWGYTPGKWILGVVVTTHNGQQPTFMQAFMRTLLVWLAVSGLYIPFANIAVQATEYFRYKRSGITMWDTICGSKVMFVSTRSNELFKVAILIPAAIATAYYVVQKYNNLQENSANRASRSANPSTLSNREAIQTLLKKGDDLALSGHYKEALDQYAQILHADPTFAPAFERQSQIYNVLGQYQIAIDSSNKCVSLNPNYGPAYMSRAKSYCHLNQLDKALSDASKAQALDPQSAWECHNLQGIVYLRQKQPQRALSESNTAIKLNPKHPDCYKVRGDIYLELGQNKLAISDFTQAITLYPIYTRAYEARARAYEKSGNHALASKDRQIIKELHQKMSD